ncbi:hypothetical protein quinque_007222 [Culex quinquefasciatus]
MTKLTLFALMAAIVAIIRACTFSPLAKDQGEHVSYDGTVESMTIETLSGEKSEQTFIAIKGCVRASIVRDANHVEVSLQSCNGSSINYELELAEALGELETNKFGISSKEQGYVKFTECLSNGGSISINLAVERKCSATKVCRVIVSGRKELAIKQYGLMRSFDARNLQPNGDNAGCLIGGQASVMLMGLLVAFQRSGHTSFILTKQIMTNLTLVALMAAIGAIIRACTIFPLENDPREHVSYDGTVDSITLETRANSTSEQAFVKETFIAIKGCVRASIVRDANHVRVSVQSCNGTSIDYEQKLVEALGQLETNRFGIFRIEQGFVKFTECLSTGESISFYLAVERLCSVTKVCRVVASGRKKLAISQYGLMKSFDANILLLNVDNAGWLIGGQASVMIMGLLVFVFQVVIPY